MADNFGLIIGVEGEKEFKKALSEINQNFKVLGSEMKLVSSNESLNNLADSMSVYGDAAQAYFSGEAVAEQTVTDDLSVYDFTVGTMPEGISCYGSSLILKSETTIRHYFKLEDSKEISDYTFSVNGTTLTPTEKQGYYYIDINNVSAAQTACGTSQRAAMQIFSLR